VSQLPNVRIPLTDPNSGRITREWLLPLQAITTAATDTEFADLQTAITNAHATLVTVSGQIQSILDAISFIQANVAALQAAISALQTRSSSSGLTFTFTDEQTTDYVPRVY
jgi:hypothetical protein